MEWINLAIGDSQARISIYIRRRRASERGREGGQVVGIELWSFKNNFSRNLESFINKNADLSGAKLVVGACPSAMNGCKASKDRERKSKALEKASSALLPYLTIRSLFGVMAWVIGKQANYASWRDLGKEGTKLTGFFQFFPLTSPSLTLPYLAFNQIQDQWVNISIKGNQNSKNTGSLRSVQFSSVLGARELVCSVRYSTSFTRKFAKIVDEF